MVPLATSNTGGGSQGKNHKEVLAGVGMAHLGKLRGRVAFVWGSQMGVYAWGWQFELWVG